MLQRYAFEESILLRIYKLTRYVAKVLDPRIEKKIYATVVKVRNWLLPFVFVRVGIPLLRDKHQSHTTTATVPLRHSFSSSLLQSKLRCAGATLHDQEIALNPIGADLVRMRTVAAAGKHSVFVERIVEFGVIRQQDGCIRRSGFGRHVFLRVDIGLE